MYVIAFSLLLRVQSEFFPLQHDGRAAIPPTGADSQNWHSKVNSNVASCSVHFRIRKHTRDLSKLRRSC
eukprot:1368401-Heterocapsa_arctica.AAC.1